eukprot:8496-Heterococcus_DN1.PRE.5
MCSMVNGTMARNMGTANGLRQNGKQQYINGPIASYAGSFLDNKYNGEGALLYRNGDTYDGDFVDDTKSGEGVYTFKRGAVKSFDGVWEDDQYVSGVLLYSSGDSYNGQWQSSKHHGQGVYTQYADDMSYSGEWADGERNGAGQITFGNGDLFTDIFLHDKAVGGSDARYINVTTGAVSVGDAALQLARNHGAEQSRCCKLPQRQAEETAATVAAAVAAAAEPDVSDHDGDRDDAVDDDDVDDDYNNSVANDNDNSTVNEIHTHDAQGCIYAYTVPTDGGNSSGKTLYSIGAHNTCDPIDHLEATVDTTDGYLLSLVIPCTQGTQQQLLKLMRNKLITKNIRPNSAGKFLTTLVEIMSTHLTCIGGQRNTRCDIAAEAAASRAVSSNSTSSSSSSSSSNSNANSGRQH